MNYDTIKYIKNCKKLYISIRYIRMHIPVFMYICIYIYKQSRKQVNRLIYDVLYISIYRQTSGISRKLVFLNHDEVLEIHRTVYKHIINNFFLHIYINMYVCTYYTYKYIPIEYIIIKKKYIDAVYKEI